ncbi:hypothetical protein [Rhizobium mongolense]|uniref:Uncharacterized protein n=1 Tax=Rhizobium mongolense TaxID=57676 RepID=A0A7W6WHM8_9HYPH|nr:hypothetical protein [Rhizobium mongolense]MBB4278481.1 hypothetical protein [Rhizobium mongolense]
MTVAIAMQASIRDARELADRYPNVPLLEIEALNIVDLGSRPRAMVYGLLPVFRTLS